MVFHPCGIQGAWLIDPTPHVDSRGRFLRAWCQREFSSQGIDFTPVAGQHGIEPAERHDPRPALSDGAGAGGQARALHARGDVRRRRGPAAASATYRPWYGALLSADNGRMFFVPEGCAHGCQSLEDLSEIHYMASAVYSPNDARGVRYDDPAIGIAWPLEVTAISDQDRNWPLLEPREN